jgi:hypothetical protein
MPGFYAKKAGGLRSYASRADECVRRYVSENRTILFLAFPQEVSPLHSFYTAES